MFKISKVISSGEASVLLKDISGLSDAYFIDRSKHIPNLSLDSSPNKYLSMSDVSMPPDLLSKLEGAFKDVRGIEEILVNRYYPPMGIGPHKDTNFHPYVSVVTLNTDITVLHLKSGEHWLPITDIPGQMVTIDREQIHRVDPVDRVRHSIILIRDSL